MDINTTKTSNVTPQNGEQFYHHIEDGGDTRFHEVRALPACAGGDHWGKELPVGALESSRIAGC